MLNKLKKRWELETTWDVIVVLFVFSITGSSVVFVRKPVFVLMGIDSDTSWVIKVLMWIVVVFPTYQLLFLFYGFIFGQWKFAWKFEKKMLRRFGFKNLK